jgi:two-component system, chemotaxis family, protein-glutamate methylesterase/glutaminase
MHQNCEAIIIGGSWGGLNALTRILEILPAAYPIPIIAVLHRGKGHQSDLESVIQKKVNVRVKEVEEKEALLPGWVYLAPANYHLLIEENRTFSLDTSVPVHYSRPSIDVAFESAAEVYQQRLMGIVLTGANKDGANGLKTITERGGLAIVQDPQEAESSIMPLEALRAVPNALIFTLDQIKTYLMGLSARVQRGIG